MSRRDGFARIPDWLYRHARPALGLTTADIAVYVVLEGHSNAKGLTSPSYPLIAWEAGISEAWAAKVVRRLIDHGLIERKSEGRQHRSAVYQMLKDPVLPPMPERPPSRAEARRRSQTPTQVESGEDQRRTQLHPGGAQTPTGEDPRLQLSTREVDLGVETGIGAPPLRAEDESRASDPETSTASAFEAWYAAYPVDRNRTAARREWAKTRTEHPADLLARTKQFARSVQGKDLQFVKHPTTWLRDRMWESVSLPTISPDQRAREIWERHGRPEEGTPGWDAFVAERDDERRAS